MNIRAIRVCLAGHYRRAYTDGICVYCGDFAAVWDHFLPVAVAALNYPGILKTGHKVLIHSCAECNSIAHAREFNSIKAKREYIQRKLRKKYRRILRFPDWTPFELEEVEWTTRQKIISEIRARDFMRQRVSYAKPAEMLLSREGVGKGSARRGAGTITISIKPERIDKDVLHEELRVKGCTRFCGFCISACTISGRQLGTAS